MAAFHFELVSPEKLLYSGEVDQVDVPGSEGDFGVLAGHAPLIAMLRPGIVTIFASGGNVRVMVGGGFAEANPAGLTVLADMAMPVDDVDPAVIAGRIKDLEEDVADSTDGAARDRLQRQLDQLKSVQASLAQ